MPKGCREFGRASTGAWERAPEHDAPRATETMASRGAHRQRIDEAVQETGENHRERRGEAHRDGSEARAGLGEVRGGVETRKTPAAREGDVLSGVFLLLSERGRGDEEVERSLAVPFRCSDRHGSSRGNGALKAFLPVVVKFRKFQKEITEKKNGRKRMAAEERGEGN